MLTSVSYDPISTARWSAQFGLSPEDIVGKPLQTLEVFSSDLISEHDKDEFLTNISGLTNLSKGAHSMLVLQTQARNVSRCDGAGVASDLLFSPVLCSLHSFPIVRQVEFSSFPGAMATKSGDAVEGGSGAARVIAEGQVGSECTRDGGDDDAVTEDSIVQANTQQNAATGTTKANSTSASFSPAAALSAIFDSSMRSGGGKKKESEEEGGDASPEDTTCWWPSEDTHVVLVAVAFSVVKELSPHKRSAGDTRSRSDSPHPSLSDSWQLARNPLNSPLMPAADPDS